MDPLSTALAGLRAVLSDKELRKHDNGCGCLMYAESSYLQAGGEEFEGAHYLRHPAHSDYPYPGAR